MRVSDWAYAEIKAEQRRLEFATSDFKSVTKNENHWEMANLSELVNPTSSKIDHRNIYSIGNAQRNFNFKNMQRLAYFDRISTEVVLSLELKFLCVVSTQMQMQPLLYLNGNHKTHEKSKCKKKSPHTKKKTPHKKHF